MASLLFGFIPEFAKGPGELFFAFEPSLKCDSMNAASFCCGRLSCAIAERQEPADTSKATIERIMPQTLNDEWREDLGEDHSQIYDNYLDTVGNLTLTGYNPELGNLPFEEKKEKLQNTHFEITRWILEKEQWNAETIVERAKWLTNAAKLRWSY